MFSETIARNIAFGDDEPDYERMRQAAETANAHAFIMNLPMAYDTPIGESGLALSGGQKQRVAIARALYGDPPILIFDEATSALDTESERAIQSNLGRMMAGRTSIVIAHRLSTIRDADTIMVLGKRRDRRIRQPRRTHGPARPVFPPLQTATRLFLDPMSTPVSTQKTRARRKVGPAADGPAAASSCAASPSLFILGFAALLAAAVFVKIPESVRCSFVLVPDNGDDPVQAPYQAVVQAIHVTESQEVQAGAELFTLRADEVPHAGLTHLQSMKEDLRSRQDISVKLDAANEQQLRIKDAELAQTERELEFRQQHVRHQPQARGHADQAGGRRRPVAGSSSPARKLDLAESEKNLNVTQKEVEATKLARQKMETDRERERAEENPATRS